MPMAASSCFNSRGNSARGVGVPVTGGSAAGRRALRLSPAADASLTRRLRLNSAQPPAGVPTPPLQYLKRRSALLSTLVAPLLLGGSRPAEASSPGEAETVPRRFESVDGISVLRLRDSGSGLRPTLGDEVDINFTARLASKQGWYFENTYQHKGSDGFPVPYTFSVGDGSVIAGLDAAVRQMQKGDIMRAVIPPQLSYQNTTQGPVPQEWSNRRRLYSTVFNEVRMANDAWRGGAGSCADVEVFVPEAAAAECGATVERIVTVVNEAYSYGEEGMWRAANAERCDAEDVAALLRARKLTVLSSAGCIVGTVCVDTAAGELGMLAVAATHRGCGLGRLLVDEAERRCREAGAASISLQLLTPVDYAHPMKVRLERWYVSLGYVKADGCDFEDLYPKIAPLLACKCKLTTYVKRLRPLQPPEARSSD